MTDYAKRIADEYASGNINSYMAERLAKASEFGMTDYLLDCALDDAKGASELDIESDDDYNLRFFVLHVADDMLGDTFGVQIPPEDKKTLCKYILTSKGDGEKLEDLTDFRVLMHKWLCDKDYKKAYPNTFGKSNREKTYDRYKWVDTIKVVYSLLKEKGLSKDAAIELATVDWSDDERFRFTNWLRYYESGNTEKYNVKTAMKPTIDLDDLGLPSHMLDPTTRSNNIGSTMSAHMPQKQEQTRREKDIEKALNLKTKMRSRLRSLRRLLDHYNDVLPHQSIESIQDEMYALDKSIGKLNVRASIEDCIIRSANRIKRMGFEEGAEVLYKFAEDPAAQEEQVIESLPPAEPSTPDTPNVDLEMVIQRLEGLTKLLKSRDLIRDMASVDILLNELGLASYFPELGDSQSKLIEAFSYASNRVEGIVSKLRGSGKSISKHPDAASKQQVPPQLAPEQPQPQQQPQAELNPEELRSQPVGRMQRELPTG